MLSERTVWLAANAASGSNSDEAVAGLEAALTGAGCRIGRTIAFPEAAPPTAAELDAEGIELLAIFTGDGSINSIVTGLYGWGGAVLVLPGGTMNLLSQRLHGDAQPDEIIARISAGRARRVRPTVVRAPGGEGLTGILAGPGTAWNDVREAMREADVLGLIGSATDAIGESAGGPKVACREPACGREEGYSLIMLTPTEQGIAATGYYAETLADYARQGMALLRRNFREGPHDDLGLRETVVLACPAGEAMGLLIDGEPGRAPREEHFTLARCEVDLLATVDA